MGDCGGAHAEGRRFQREGRGRRAVRRDGTREDVGGVRSDRHVGQLLGVDFDGARGRSPCGQGRRVVDAAHGLPHRMPYVRAQGIRRTPRRRLPCRKGDEVIHPFPDSHFFKKVRIGTDCYTMSRKIMRLTVLHRPQDIIRRPPLSDTLKRAARHQFGQFTGRRVLRAFSDLRPFGGRHVSLDMKDGT